MDPYLESPVYWGGFHAKLIAALSTALNGTLPAGYYAEIDEHVWLQADAPDDRRLLGKPDTFVTAANGTAAGGRVALAEPTAHVTLPRGRRKAQKYVKIVGPDRATVVTVIEVLSPSNKETGPDRVKYLGKRDEYFGAATNLVEIDLLRDGERMPMGKPSPPGADYYIFVLRGACYPEADVWGFTVRNPVPSIPVPLKQKDGSVPAHLQRLLDEIYDTSRYAARIDYAQPPVPALREPDAEWAADLTKKAVRRKKK
jgi:hypothetical protein